jgi:acyl transferase domain-containing protein
LKSNIGHGEGASGVASLTKVIIAYENQCIPANLNLKKLKSSIALMSPPFFPVNDNLPYTPGIKIKLKHK